MSCPPCLKVCCIKIGSKAASNVSWMFSNKRPLAESDRVLKVLRKFLSVSFATSVMTAWPHQPVGR